LQFLTQYIGFTRTRIIGLQESVQIRDNPKPPTLFQVLNEASPDYAVIAQKAGDVNQMMLFDEAFSRNFGLSLDGLAARYDAGIQGQLHHTNHQMHEMQRLLRPFIRLMKLKEKLLSWFK
jgi:O-antigen chain-terminating methyltransferase